MITMMTMATQSSPRRPPPPPPPPRRMPPHVMVTPAATNGQGNAGTESNQSNSNSNENESLTAAADLIRTLDSAFEEMSSLSASAAKDAEDARRNARAASEVARRYTARSFPQQKLIAAAASTPPSPKRSTAVIAAATSGSSSNNNNSKSPERALTTKSSPPSSALTTISGESRHQTTRKRKIPKQPPSSAERLAQSHADDVLSLSLELERTKHELERERCDHDHARTATTEHRAKNAQLEAQMERLLVDMEQQREDHGRTVDRMQQELARAHVRMEAAEEDAQAAVDLATEAAESRQQLEEWLEKALEEVALLRDQMERVGVAPGSVMPTAATPNGKHSVRFAESPTVNTIPNRDGTMIIPPPPPPRPPPPLSTPSRSMITAGRTILEASRSPPYKMHAITLTPEKSADRRQRLRDRLKSLNEDDAMLVRTPTPNKRSPGGVDMGLGQSAMEACHSVANVVRASARVLKLPGRWGTDATVLDDVAHVDNVTRRYCNAVEVRSMIAVYL